MTQIADFKFSAPVQRAVEEAAYTTPTPIQAQAIPYILARKDVIGIAQTGTGKTAAFVLPTLQYLSQNPKTLPRGTPRVLVLAPTRELAAQIEESFRSYGKYLPFSSVALFGGVSQIPQVHALSKGVDIVIATPGRLLDLMRQRHVALGAVDVFVLDEADRMLEMGFAEDIKLLASALPGQRQTLLFSATLSQGIAALTHNYLHQPVKVTVAAQASTVEKTVQTVMYVDKEDKVKLLLRLLMAETLKRAIVFIRMKHTADKLTQKLVANNIAAEALHSDKTQAMRTRILDDFRAGKLRVLVATDIAARGLDVDDVTHVINYDLPKDPETYVHRIGRTARAGADGNAITFCSGDDRAMLAAIERLINKKLIVKEHKYHSSFAQNGGLMKSNTKPVERTHKPGRGLSKITSVHKARLSKKWVQK